MMNLAIDIGNTSIKYAIFEERQMLHHARIMGHELMTMRSDIEKWNISRCIVCSTIPLDSGMRQTIRAISPGAVFFNHTTKIPIINCYKTPQTLGMDRLAAVIGAYQQTHCNTLVIDMGTAITFDFITENGEYLGGNISPGMKMRFRALHEQTAQLPLIGSEGEHPPFGTDTDSAIRCGVLDGIRYEIEGYIRKLFLNYPNLCIFLTGGDHFNFDNDGKMRIFADSNIVLKGLNEVILHHEH